MTSSTSLGFTFDRSRAALIATAPRSCAGVLANAPLKEPTAVRAALAMTMSPRAILFSQVVCGLLYMEGAQRRGEEEVKVGSLRKPHPEVAGRLPVFGVSGDGRNA